MPFGIPNAGSAAFNDQAQVDSVDLQIITAAQAGTGVVSGCTVTTTGTGNGSVSVATGTVRINNILYTVPATTVAIAANASGNPRYDLITVPTGTYPNSGTPVATQGTAAAAPLFPAIPANSVVLASVRVATGHTTTTTVAANTITDKRLILSPLLDTHPGGSSDPWEYRIQQTDPAKSALLVRGVIDPGAALKPIFQTNDYQDAPIFWVSPVGGTHITDDMGTDYTVLGPQKFRADVYGYMWRGTQASFVYPGPPGNMLSFDDACHEVYQFTRNPTVAGWGIVSGSTTLTTFDFGAPPTGSPTGFRTGMRLSASAAVSLWIAQPGGATALQGITAGDTVSLVANIRRNVSGAVRTAQVRLSWYNAGGTQVGSDVNGSAVNVPTDGTWVSVGLAAQVAPATATRVQMHILINSVASGESFDIAGCGVMRGQAEAIFGPPFIGSHPTDEKIAYGSFKGDRWVRTDASDTPGMREYVCRVGGYPYQQYWDPLDVSDVRRVRLDQAFSSVTLAAVNGWSFAVTAAREYQVDVSMVLHSAALTTGWQVGWSGPAMTSVLSVAEYQSSATAWTTNTITSNAMPANHAIVTAAYVASTNILMRIRAHFVPSASGTIQFNMASEVAASAVTIKRGSTLSVT